jgi:hypothetical protein
MPCPDFLLLFRSIDKQYLKARGLLNNGHWVVVPSCVALLSSAVTGGTALGVLKQVHGWQVACSYLTPTQTQYDEHVFLRCRSVSARSMQRWTTL